MKYLLLSFVLLSTGIAVLQAQPTAPGGVVTPKVWLRAVPYSGGLNGFYHWQNSVDDTTRVRLASSFADTNGHEYLLPRDSVRAFSFNPAMGFFAGSKAKALNLNNTDFARISLFSVWGASEQQQQGEDMLLMTLNGKSDEGLIVSKDKLMESAESGKSDFDYGSLQGNDLLYRQTDPEGDTTRFRERSLRILTLFRANMPAPSAWGPDQHSTLWLGSRYTAALQKPGSTLNPDAGANHDFAGYSPEVIAYDRALTPLERRRVESYLALKYGITLDVSYIGSDGSLVWDADANRAYGNRIAAYGHDDVSGWNSNRGVTSYEEAPRFATDTCRFNDSFDAGDSYSGSSRYRLMSIGTQEAGMLSNGEQVMWGDNGMPVATNDTLTDGTHLMQRRWMVASNIAPSRKDEPRLQWNGAGIKVFDDGYSQLMVKPYGLAENAFAVSAVPLGGKAGYLSWKTGQAGGDAATGFVAADALPASADGMYGYLFDAGGKIFSLQKGTVSLLPVAGYAVEDRVEIEKYDTLIVLKINGKHILKADMVVMAADRVKSFYGAVNIRYGGKGDVSLAGFEHGGFADTGHRVELSYDRAPEFYDYKDYRCYLLIDRTGSGDFSAPGVERYRMDDMDATRKKIVFDHIFWNTQGTGKEIFTFGFRRYRLSAGLTVTPPTCTNNVPQADGAVKIGIRDGVKGYLCSFGPTTVTPDRYTRLYDDTLTLHNLPYGDYYLTIREIGGTTFTPKPAGGEAWSYSTYPFLHQDQAMIRCVVGDQATVGTIGFSPAPGQPAAYGLYAENGKLFSVNRGTRSSSPLISFAKGDSIIIYRSVDEFSALLNNTIIASLKIAPAEQNAGFRATVQMVEGSLCNVKMVGMALPAAWVSSPGMKADVSTGARVQYKVSLVPECMTAPLPHDTGYRTDSRNIMVYYTDPSAATGATVRLTLDEPSPAAIWLFDSAGRLVSETNLPQNARIHEAPLKFPATGVYRIKAVTDHHEYSASVLGR
jgi:hypothetical protein